MVCIGTNIVAGIKSVIITITIMTATPSKLCSSTHKHHLLVNDLPGVEAADLHVGASPQIVLELALTAHDARHERLGHRDRHQTAVVVVDRLAVMFDPRPRNLGRVAGTATATAGQATVGRLGRLHLAVTVNNGHSMHAYVITFIQHGTELHSRQYLC